MSPLVPLALFAAVPTGVAAPDPNAETAAAQDWSTVATRSRTCRIAQLREVEIDENYHGGLVTYAPRKTSPSNGLGASFDLKIFATDRALTPYAASFFFQGPNAEAIDPARTRILVDGQRIKLPTKGKKSPMIVTVEAVAIANVKPLADRLAAGRVLRVEFHDARGRLVEQAEFDVSGWSKAKPALDAVGWDCR